MTLTLLGPSVIAGTIRVLHSSPGGVLRDQGAWNTPPPLAAGQSPPPFQIACVLRRTFQRSLKGAC